MIRRVIQIDTEKCNGCGLCATACHEGAIAIVDGKAKLMRDDYCDGLGDCLPSCPMQAISFVEREAAAYDEEAVQKHLEKRAKEQQTAGCPGSQAREIKRPQGGCPGSQAREIERPQGGCPGSQPRAIEHPQGGCPGSQAKMIKRSQEESVSVAQHTTNVISELRQWPVQIKLMPVKAPYYDGADLLIAADCTAYAYANFHNDFIRDKITVIGCPKLDDIDYSEKLTEILRQNDIKSVHIVRMEVPCCGGLLNAAKVALQNCGKMIPWQVTVVGTDGTILQ